MLKNFLYKLGLSVLLLGSIWNTKHPVNNKRPRMLHFLQILSMLRKENEILLRNIKASHKKLRFTNHDRRCYLKTLQRIPKLKTSLSLVQAQTILKLWKKQIQKHWIYSGARKKVGAKPIEKKTRALILNIKKHKPFWGALRIEGELQSLHVHVSRETIRKIIHQGYKRRQFTAKWLLAHIFEVSLANTV